MFKFRPLILAAALVGLSGCSAFTSFSEVQALNEAQATGSPFTQNLAAEYREFADTELKKMLDYPDALHFARKGLAAADGTVVMPEPLADWDLEVEHMDALGAARGRLILAFDLGARETVPELSAVAQARFDCWIEQQEEDYASDDIETCKSQFMDAMNQVEAQLQPPAPAVVAPADDTMFDVDSAEPMAPQNAMYLVFFDWDSAELTSAAFNVLDAVADEIAQNPPAGVDITGHADTSGPQDYNRRLALKRAEAVRQALLERGVDPNMLEVNAKGETEPLVPTPDGVREPANRRVNISFTEEMAVSGM